MTDEEAFAKALEDWRGVSSTVTVDMTVFGRKIKFDLYFDPDFVSDVNTRLCLEYSGACEPELIHLMRRVLRPGDFAIDGGANIGFMTMAMSVLVGRQGHVEAFEPATVNFKRLRANIALNKVENVNVVNCALWSENVPVTLHQGLDSGLSSLAPFEGALATLPCRGLTLDRWCESYNPKPRLLKLDVEGAEERALLGAKKLLIDGIDFVTCEVNPDALARFDTTQMDLRDTMAGFGYSTFILAEDGSRPMMVDRSDKIAENRTNLNVLFSDVDTVHEAWGRALT